jgi:hypothetical protein
MRGPMNSTGAMGDRVRLPEGYPLPQGSAMRPRKASAPHGERRRHGELWGIAGLASVVPTTPPPLSAV